MPLSHHHLGGRIGGCRVYGLCQKGNKARTYGPAKHRTAKSPCSCWFVFSWRSDGFGHRIATRRLIAGMMKSHYAIWAMVWAARPKTASMMQMLSFFCGPAQVAMTFSIWEPTKSSWCTQIPSLATKAKGSPYENLQIPFCLSVGGVALQKISSSDRTTDRGPVCANWSPLAPVNMGTSPCRPANWRDDFAEGAELGHLPCSGV